MKLIYELYPENTPKPFKVDMRFKKKLLKYSWFYWEQRVRARAKVKIQGVATRQFLHRFVLTLAKLYYPEVYFADGDPFNCTLVNLKPYDPAEQGATRRKYKTKNKFKGVYYKENLRKWTAAIRYKGKYIHLGYFPDSQSAAAAYAREFKMLHPNLGLLSR